MDDIEALISALRTLYAKLAVLHLVEGPELFLPGRSERCARDLEEMGEAMNHVREFADQLMSQGEQERERIAQALRQYAHPDRFR